MINVTEHLRAITFYNLQTHDIFISVSKVIHPKNEPRSLERKRNAVSRSRLLLCPQPSHRTRIEGQSKRPLIRRGNSNVRIAVNRHDLSPIINYY